MMRHAFATVMENYNHMRSILGTAQAVDYSRMASRSGRSGYGGESKSYPLTDFTIDVENAVKQTLKGDDLTFFYTSLKDKPIDFSVQTEEFMRIQEKMGRVFLSRGLYPIQKYFTVIKK